MPPVPMPDDWQRALVVAAHPDDIEYGVAAAVAVWTAAGKEVHYSSPPGGGRHRGPVAGPVSTIGTEPPHVVDVSDGVEKAVASLTEHRRYLEALSDETVEEQARRHVDMATLTEDGGRRIGFQLYWG